MHLDITPFVSGRLEAFLLLFVRLSAVLMTVPVFSLRAVPFRIRIFLGLALAFTLLPLVPPMPGLHGADAVTLSLMIANEALLGVIIGFVASAMVFAVQIGGELLGLQIGYGIGSIVDPRTENQSVVTTEFFYMLFVLVFLSMNGHHLLLRGAVATLDRVPLGEFRLTPAMVDMLAHEMSEIFAVALRIGAPVMAFLFISSVALGIISRTMPQMNVFVVGFPIKIIGGLAVLLMTIPGLRVAFEELTTRIGSDLAGFVRLL